MTDLKYVSVALLSWDPMVDWWAIGEVDVETLQVVVFDDDDDEDKEEGQGKGGEKGEGEGEEEEEDDDENEPVEHGCIAVWCAKSNVLNPL